MQTGALAPDNATPGRTLAAARTERGMSVSEVAQRLKFSVRHIEALEADHYDALPGGPYVRGMVRTYAKLLGVDAARLLDALPQPDRGGEPAPMEPRDMSVPFPQDTGPSSRVYLLLSMLIIVAVVVVLAEWFIRSQRGNPAETALPPVAVEPKNKAVQPAEPVPPAAVSGEMSPPAAATPTATAPATIPPQPSAETQTEAPAGAPAPQASAVAMPPTGESTQAGVSTPVTRQAVANGASPVPTDGHASTQPAPLKPGQSRLTFNFDLESWVEVKDADGDVLYSALNEPGTEKSIVGTAPFSVVIGNASGVRLTYKGEPVTLKPHRSSDVARLTLE